MKNKGENLTKPTLYRFDFIGSTLFKFVSSIGKLSSLIQNYTENIIKIN